jgi:hypothetical protein
MCFDDNIRMTAKFSFVLMYLIVQVHDGSFLDKGKY